MIQKSAIGNWHKKLDSKIGTKNSNKKLAQKTTIGNWYKSVSKNKRESKMAQKD